MRYSPQLKLASIRIIVLLCVLFLVGRAGAGASLNERLAAIDAELKSLPKPRIHTLPPNLGFESEMALKPDQVEWVEIDLNEATPVDTIVVEPMVFQDSDNRFHAHCFPLRFKIEALSPNGTYQLVADHSAEDFTFPTEEPTPLVFQCPENLMAEKVRFTAMRLTRNLPRGGGSYTLGLSEIMIFSGMQNVALNQPVKASSEKPFPLTFSPEYLVDGHTFHPPIQSTEPRPNEAFRAFGDTPATFIFHLEQEETLNELRIYAHNSVAGFSHLHSFAQGFPSSIKLWIGEDIHAMGQPVLKIKKERMLARGVSVFMKRFPPTTGRVVKIELSDGNYSFIQDKPVVATSEIELLHNGKNILAGRTPSNTVQATTGYTPKILTDGHTADGRIHPLKDWMLKLDRYARLSAEKQQLLAKKEAQYEMQQKRLRMVGVTALALPFLLIIIALIFINQQQRKLQKMRERIAGNLHDDVGATLSGVAIRAEHLNETLTECPESERRIIHQIMTATRETARDLRTLVNFLENRGDAHDLIGQFKTLARKMLYNLSIEETYQDAAFFDKLTPITRWNLILFFKEALNNVVKHAYATKVTIKTKAERHTLHLSIQDNGTGTLPAGTLPAHLEKRAQLIGGKLTAQSRPNEGTLLELTIPLKRRT